MQLTSSTFETHLSQHPWVLVKFYAPWCGHCKSLAPRFDEAATHLAASGKPGVLAKVDVTQEEDLGQIHNIEGFPTLLLFNNGKLYKEYDGKRTVDDLVSFIERAEKGELAADEPNDDGVEGEDEANEEEAEQVDKDWDDEHITSLTDDTFEEFVKSHQGVVLVEFYATWCFHCQMFRETFAEIAAKLANEPAIKLAKVEATKSPILAQTFEIQGFPTLHVLKDGKDLGQYEGERSASDIERHLRRLVRPAVASFESVADVTRVLEAGEEDVLVVALFSGQSSRRDAFEKAADALRTSAMFAVISNPAEFAAAGGADGEVVVHSASLSKEEDTDKKVAISRATYTGELSEAALSQFVRINSLPVFAAIDPSSFQRYANSRLPILMVLHQDGKSQDVVDFARANAEEVRKYGIVTTSINTSELPELPEDLGVKEGAVPIVVLDYHNEQHFLYGDRPLTTEALTAFANGIVAGTLPPHRRSQDAPASNDEPVKVVVGSTFEDMVFRDEQDVLIEFYAPWCGHCKKLAPKYERLATLLSSVSSIVVAKMDASANDPPSRPEFQISGVPSVLLVRKDGKILTFEGSRTLTALLDFVHENTSTPFEKPVLGEEDQDDDAGADEFDFEGDEEVVEGSGDGDALESGDELQNLFDEGLHDEL